MFKTHVVRNGDEIMICQKENPYLSKLTGIPVSDRKEIYDGINKLTSVLDLIRVMNFYGIKYIELNNVKEQDISIIDNEKFKSYISDILEVSINVEITGISYDSFSEQLVASLVKITID